MRKDLIDPNYYYVVLGWPLGKVCYFYLMSRSYMRHGGITVSEIEKLLHSECITFYKEANYSDGRYKILYYSIRVQ